MSELEPNDSRVVHGNAKPEKGDERFAQKPTQAQQFDRAQQSLDDGADTPASTSKAADERGSQQEQSVNNDPQFEASELDRGEAQYQSDPLVQQQHQQNDWDDDAAPDTKKDKREDAAQDFETGQADYGGAQAREDMIEDAESEGDLSDNDIDDAAPQQAKLDRKDDAND